MENRNRIILNGTMKKINDSKKDASNKIKEAVKINKKKKKNFTLNDGYAILTPTQLKIMTDESTDIILVTGKEYGKGYIITIKIIGHMEMNPLASAFALKKYKTNAGDRLHQTIKNLSEEIRLNGFSIPYYDKGQGKTYRMVNHIKVNNTSIEYGGFDDYNSITGVEAFNLGTFPIVFFDEPSQMDDDPTKVPDQATWDMKINGMKSSIARSNTRHMRAFRVIVPPTQYYYALNPWDDHPLVMETEKIIPEREFMEFIMKDVLNNHTIIRKDEENDKLYVRGTMFGNPIINLFESICVKYNIKSLLDFENIKDEIDYSSKECERFFINNGTLRAHLKKRNGIPVYIQARKAIVQKDTAKLAEILGLRFVGKSKFKPVYDITDIKTMDTDLVLKNMDSSSAQIVAWDVDQRKGGRFVATPTWVAYKTYKGRVYKNIIIGKQREIKSHGVGKKGERIDLYTNKMYEYCKNTFRNFKSKSGESTSFIFDNNGKNYINNIDKLLNPLGSETPPSDRVKLSAADFKTRKTWTVMKRQSWLQTSFDFGYPIIDKDNIGLFKDLKISVSKEGNKQRDESGAKANVYDRINSMEYSVYYFRGESKVSDYPPGETYMYETEIEEKDNEKNILIKEEKSLDDLLEFINNAL